MNIRGAPPFGAASVGETRKGANPAHFFRSLKMFALKRGWSRFVVIQITASWQAQLHHQLAFLPTAAGTLTVSDRADKPSDH